MSKKLETIAYKVFCSLKEEKTKQFLEATKHGRYGELEINEEDEMIGDKQSDRSQLKQSELKALKNLYLSDFEIVKQILYSVKQRWNINSRLFNIRSRINKLEFLKREDKDNDLNLKQQIELEYLKELRKLIEAEANLKEVSKAIDDYLLITEETSEKLQEVAESVRSQQSEYGKIYKIKSSIRVLNTIIRTLERKSKKQRGGSQVEFEF